MTVFVAGIDARDRAVAEVRDPLEPVGAARAVGGSVADRDRRDDRVRRRIDARDRAGEVVGDPDAVVVRVDAELAAVADRDRRHAVRRRVDAVDVVRCSASDPDRAGAGADARRAAAGDRIVFTTLLRLRVDARHRAVRLIRRPDGAEPVGDVPRPLCRPGCASCTFEAHRIDAHDLRAKKSSTQSEPPPSRRRRRATSATLSRFDDAVRRRVDAREHAGAVVVDVEVLAVRRRCRTAVEAAVLIVATTAVSRASRRRTRPCRPPWTICYEFVLKCCEIVLLSRSSRGSSFSPSSCRSFRAR